MNKIANLHRSILEAALDCIIVIDADGIVTDLNQAAIDTFGFAPKEILGRSLTETIVPPHMQQAHEDGMKLWRKTGEGPVFGKRIEVPAMRKCGEIFPAELTVTQVTTENDEKIVAAYIRDLSSTREVEEKLKLSEFSLESLSDAMFWIDESGSFFRVNEAATKSLGYDRSELLKMTVFDMDMIMRPEIWQDHWDELREKGSVVVKSRHRRKDGSEFPVEVSTNLIKFGDKEINCALVRDLTFRDSVARELRAAKNAAEKANAAKSEFLAKMSHEIRTPLTAIMGFSDMMLLGGGLSAEQLRSVQRIQGNSEYLLELIGDILDLTRVEAGRVDISIGKIDLNALLRDVDEVVRYRVLEKLLTWKIGSSTPVPRFFMSDPIRLRQILLNILGNAVKYTSFGAVGLDVSWKSTSATSGELWFRVQDTGPGIPESEVERIFEPFSQIERKERGLLGVGLGLNIARALATELDGEILVQSRIGQGTTFQVCLKVEVESGEVFQHINEQDLQSQNAARLVDYRQTLIEKKVLVADDNPDNQLILRYILESAGAHVDIVPDGRAAVDAIMTEGRTYDVVLMDMQMPVLDGYGATKELRARGYGDRIVAITAAAMEEDRRRCLQAGCDAYVSKPVTPEVLLREIERLDREAGSKENLGQQVDPAEYEDLDVLIERYKESLADHLADLIAANSEDDHELLGTIAHKLKGTGSAYGFPEITSQATLLESALRLKEPSDVVNVAASELVEVVREVIE